MDFCDLSLRDFDALLQRVTDNHVDTGYFSALSCVKHILAGIVRFRTIMPCVSIYLFLRFRKLYFCVFMTLIDALRFHSTACIIAKLRRRAVKTIIIAETR